MSPNEKAVPALRLQGVTKSYGSRNVLRGIELEVHAGEIVGLVGLNGAGKTTLLEGVAGLRRFDAGEVRLFGWDASADRKARTRSLGVQLQTLELPDKMTVGEALRLHALYHKTGDVASLAGRFGLKDRLAARFEVLSLGERQRLSAALAVLHGPKLLLLDEPMASMDPLARRDYVAFLRDFQKAGGAALLSTHDLGEASRICDRVVLLHEGCIQALDTLSTTVALPRAWVAFSAVVSDSWFAGLSGLGEVLPKENGWLVDLREPELALAALATKAASEGPALTRIEYGSPSVSDLFASRVSEKGKGTQ